MGMLDDLQGMTTALAVFPPIPIRAHITRRAENRLRTLAREAGVTDEELCSAILAMVLDHADHIKIMTFNTAEPKAAQLYRMLKEYIG